MSFLDKLSDFSYWVEDRLEQFSDWRNRNEEHFFVAMFCSFIEYLLMAGVGIAVLICLYIGACAFFDFLSTWVVGFAVSIPIVFIIAFIKTFRDRLKIGL
jgi:uncharacterized membrane protein YjjP (DUF1212 family)